MRVDMPWNESGHLHVSDVIRLIKDTEVRAAVSYM